ncbi:MAG: hypothetical protein ACYC9O_06230 [Candidatus Latescibacterota bacterium]
MNTDKHGIVFTIQLSLIQNQYITRSICNIWKRESNAIATLAAGKRSYSFSFIFMRRWLSDKKMAPGVQPENAPDLRLRNTEHPRETRGWVMAAPARIEYPADIGSGTEPSEACLKGNYFFAYRKNFTNPLIHFA